jgi:hypothetical protein
MIEDDPDVPPFGIRIENAGPGPARIKSVNWFVDRKPVGDVEKAVDIEKLVNVNFVEFDENDTLGVGAKEQLLEFSHKTRGSHDDKDLDKFIDILDSHLAVEVEFCPVLGSECSKKCSTKGWCE